MVSWLCDIKCRGDLAAVPASGPAPARLTHVWQAGLQAAGCTYCTQSDGVTLEWGMVTRAPAPRVWVKGGCIRLVRCAAD